MTMTTASSERTVGQFTILLVDDEDDLRATIRRTLRSPEYFFREAADASEALEVLAGGGVDAVISDYNMPHMNGLDFLQRVRITYPQVVRMMLTGQADIRLAVRALNEGAAHRLLLKPWDSFDLKGIVRMALTTCRTC